MVCTTTEPRSQPVTGFHLHVVPLIQIVDGAMEQWMSQRLEDYAFPHDGDL